MYSPIFKTLHDEAHPVGNLGRGTHYSVLRAATWHDGFLNPLKSGALLDFAVIWDEDHDTRVIEAIHALYFGGLLAPVRFIGERKGGLSVLVALEAFARWAGDALVQYSARVDKCVEEAEKRIEDCWVVAVGSAGGDSSIINDESERVEAYLGCIQMLWNLGVKPYTAGALGSGDRPARQ